MNRQHLGIFAMETLEALTNHESKDGADEDRYVGAAFIVAYEKGDGDLDVAFRTTSSDASSNIQMLQRATFLEARTWARLAAKRARGDDAS